jgi:hypothetical protein
MPSLLCNGAVLAELLAGRNDRRETAGEVG